MIDFGKPSSARRWVFPMLVLFLVLGHACDLPAYVDFVNASHTAEESHRSGDGHHSSGDGHHSDEQALSCGAATATSSPGYPQVAAPEILVVSQVDEPAPIQMGVRSFEGSAKFSVRPPLFLLHASLLI